MPSRIPSTITMLPFVLKGPKFQWVFDMDQDGNLLFSCLDSSGTITTKVRVNRDGTIDAAGSLNNSVVF